MQSGKVRQRVSPGVLLELHREVIRIALDAVAMIILVLDDLHRLYVVSEKHIDVLRLLDTAHSSILHTIVKPRWTVSHNHAVLLAQSHRLLVIVFDIPRAILTDFANLLII